MIRKTLFSLLALMVIGLLALPWVIGKTAEQAYRQQLDALLGGQLLLLHQDYRRGWRSSQALLELEVRETGERLTLAQQIHHGPLTPGGYPLLAWMESDLVGEGDPSARPLRGDLRTRLHWDGSALTHIQLPYYRLHWQDQWLEVQQIQGEIHSNASSIEGKITLAQASTHQNGQKTMHAEGITSDWTRELADSDTHSSRFWCDIDQLSLLPESGDSWLSFSTLSISGDHQLAQQQVQAGISLASDQIRFGEHHFGPMEMHVNIRNLPAHALEELQDNQTLDTIGQLLAGNPKIALEHLYLHTAEGELDASLLVEYTAGRAPLSLPELLSGLRADGNLRIAGTLLRSLLNSAPNYSIHPDSAPQDPLHTLIEQGLIIPQGEDFISQLRLLQGRITLNGQPIPLPLGAVIQP